MIIFEILDKSIVSVLNLVNFYQCFFNKNLKNEVNGGCENQIIL